MVSLRTRMMLVDLPILVFVAVFFLGIYILVKVELIAGILVMFCSFIYGIPISCVFCIERRKTIKIAMLITSMDRITIPLLAENTGCREKEARDKVVWCIGHGYVPGYLLKGDEVVNSKSIDPNNEEHAVECPNCGASFTYLGKIGECPYCGDYYPPKNKR